MLFATLSGFLAATVGPWLSRRAGDRIGWIVAILPATLTLYFAAQAPGIIGGQPVAIDYAWYPALGIRLSLLLDGLSLLFALLICGVGTFVFIYAGRYLRGHAYLGRFVSLLLAFMSSMLGLVLSDNLISLFVFWELTSVTSYLLIGFNHDDPKARTSALQGLLVTSGGGLAMLAGFVLLGEAGETYSIGALLGQGAALRGHDLYPAFLLCILAGAFTKSAQVPFHFWLPNAMAAPTPVSAYLHSATMVKAGIYLLARLSPALGGTELWTTTVSLVGGVTMFTGAFLAFRSTDLKRILAYSTIMALGTLTMLLGIGSDAAIVAFATFLLAHSLYKGALFLIAGIIDHETGTKDVLRLGGLHRKMRITMAATVVSAVSLSGLPPLFGFVAKELMFDAVLQASWMAGLLVVLAVSSAMLTVAVAAVVAIRPFLGPPKEYVREPHEAPIALLVGPVVLGTFSLAFGAMPFLAEAGMLRAAVTAVFGAPVDFSLALWHGFNTALVLSILSAATGILLFVFWDRILPRFARLASVEERAGPERGYFAALEATVGFAAWQTRTLQNGKVGNYLLTLIMTTVLLVGYTLITRYPPRLTFDLAAVSFIEVAVAIVLVASAIVASTASARLGAVAAMGVLGFAVALLYILFSAPDLAITQVLVETLTVILLVLVLFRLPHFMSLSSPLERVRDLGAAVLGGVLMTLLVLAAVDARYFDSISPYYIEQSLPLAHGKNVVNVIIVDFRAFDTLGEIFVLALAAIGVMSMLKLTGGGVHKS